MADESAGTGLAELDRALGGLYWGDNVVWVCDGGEPTSQGPAVPVGAQGLSAVAAFCLSDALAMTNVLWCQT
jgi:hypothetical protein